MKTDVWGLVWGRPEVDPNALARAIEAELRREGQDFRTRLLIRDSLDVLERYWGEDRWSDWLSRSEVRERIEVIRGEDLGKPGFHLSEEQLMPATKPETVKEYLRELGVHLSEPARLPIGGAIALILSGEISRSTTHIAVVDEVPEAIRSQRTLLRRLKKEYRLELTHFASRDLPAGWQGRLHSLGTFGRLTVDLVDPIDTFVSKLFSNR